MTAEDKLKRVKIVHVSEHEILAILQGSLSIELKGVPEGSQVLRVFHNDPRRCFDLIVYHESFDEVPTYELPGEIEGELTSRFTSETPSDLDDWQGSSLDDLPTFYDSQLDRIERDATDAYKHGAPAGYHAVSFRGILRLVQEIKSRRALDTIPEPGYFALSGHYHGLPEIRYRVKMEDLPTYDTISVVAGHLSDAITRNIAIALAHQGRLSGEAPAQCPSAGVSS